MKEQDKVKVISAIKEAFEEGFKCGVAAEKGYEDGNGCDAAVIIGHVADVLESGPWIKITEDPKTWPEFFQSVLVYCPEFNNIYCADMRHDRKWYYFEQETFNFVLEKVTHWMPLPQPPK